MHRKMVTLEGRVCLVAEMLKRAPAAFTIMAAFRGRAIRRRCEEFNQTGAVAIDIGGHGFARQGEGHEDLAAFMVCDAIALGAEALDEKVDRLAGHAPLQAVSDTDGQLRVMREG